MQNYMAFKLGLMLNQNEQVLSLKYEILKSQSTGSTGVGSQVLTYTD